MTKPKPTRRRLTAALVAEMRTEIGADRATVSGYVTQLGTAWRTVESAVYGWTWASVRAPAPLTPPAPPPADEPPPPTARLTVEAVADMRRRFSTGEATMGGLAREYEVSEPAARSAILGHTWRRVPATPAKRAAKGGWTVVTDHDLREIIRLRGEGQRYRAIGDALGLNHTVVFRAYRAAQQQAAASGRKPKSARGAGKG